MLSNWGLLKRIIAKKASEKNEKRPISERIDLSLPLGIRMKGIIEVPETDFILGGDQLKIKHPGSSNIVSAMGKFSIGDSTIHRFYLDAGDTIYMLQIIIDKKGAIEEGKLYMPFDEVYPNQDGWDYWLNEKDGYIGYSLFQTEDGIQYQRAWDNDGEQINLPAGTNHIPPVEFTERIYHDAYGDSWEDVQHSAMLYGRDVTEDVQEFLLVSAVEEEDGASIQLMVGIPVEPTSLKVL